MSDIPDNAPQPRLCHISKWENFQGYGFNLHADKSKPGQYIGKVDTGSPSVMAGLKEGDRIIEVNGVNIANENHKQVVLRIKDIQNETRLLVVDKETDDYFKARNIVVSKSLSNVKFGSSEETVPALDIKTVTEEITTNGTSNGHVTTGAEEDTKSVGSAASNSTHSDTSSRSQNKQKQEEVVSEQVVPSDELPELPENSPQLSKKSSSLSLSPSPIPSAKSSPAISLKSSHSEKCSPIPSAASSPTVSLKLSKVSSLNSSPLPSLKISSHDESEGSTSPDPMATYDNVVFTQDEGARSEENNDRRASISSSGTSNSSSPDQKGASVDALQESQMSTSPSPPPSLESSALPQSTTSSVNSKSASPDIHAKNTKNLSGLNLNMSVAEMRAQLRMKKKNDPRKDAGVDLREKYKIVQNL